MKSNISELIDRYWDLAYAEGMEKRTFDTINGDASNVRHQIDNYIDHLESKMAQIAEICKDTETYMYMDEVNQILELTKVEE